MQKNLLKKIIFSLSIATIASYSLLLTCHTPEIPLEVLFGNPERALPTLSPDGKQLAYCAPHQGVLNIWVKTLGTNDERVVTDFTHHGIPVSKKKFSPHFAWVAEGKKIIYEKDTNGDENYHIYAIDLESGDTRDLTPFAGVKAEILTIKNKFPDEILILMNKRNQRLFDVYKLDIKTGELQLIEENPGTIVWWLADSNLYVRAALASNPDASQTLLIKNIQGMWQSILELAFEDALKDELYCGLLAFSKDGNDLFINSSIDSNTRSIVKINLNTGKRTLLATDEVYDCAGVLFNSESGEPDAVYWEKSRIDWRIYNSEQQQHFTIIAALSNGDISSIQKSADGKKWVVSFVYDNRSQDYYLYDAVTHQAEYLFAARPVLASYQLASTEPIVLQSRDGLSLYGYITYPVGVERKNLPVVLNVHGGPFSRDLWGFNPELQWFANRGYACLQLNFRGSRGYGKKFLAAGNGEWGGKMHDDLIDAVQWAVDNEIADPKRIAIYGGSYGGYAALVGATFTPDVFCCAVDIVGPSNLVTNIESLPKYWARAPWELRMGTHLGVDFLKSRSPLFKIDNIKIPLMIAHGANDVRVPQSESEQIVEAMRKKGIPYEYLLFQDEGHGFQRPENRMIFYKAAEEFLAKNL